MDKDGKRPTDHITDALKSYSADVDRQIAHSIGGGSGHPSKDAFKYDDGKLRWSLMPMWALEPVVRVMEHGANKYGPYGYLNGDGMKWSRYYNALMRHMNSWAQGEDYDPETKQLHLAHACACSLILLCYSLLPKFKHNDDRIRKHLHERQEGEKTAQTGTGVGPQRNSPGLGAG